MNKLIHTAPPSALGRWLGRSLAWTVACVGGCWLFWHYAVDKTLAFAPGLGAIALTHEGVVGRELTVLATAVVIGMGILFAQTAIAGFSDAYRANAPNTAWLDHVAIAWYTVVKILVWAWAAFTVFIFLGCLLSLGDDGSPWHV